MARWPSVTGHDPKDSKTCSLLQIVKTNAPTWDAYKQSFGVDALYMYNKRLTDLCESDNAHLLWITVGNRMLRAHNGQTFCYNSESGYWYLFGELLPQRISEQLREYCVVLEGTFRGFEGDVGRTDQEVLKAMCTASNKSRTNWR